MVFVYRVGEPVRTAANVHAQYLGSLLDYGLDLKPYICRKEQHQVVVMPGSEYLRNTAE